MDVPIAPLTLAELNAGALERFVYQPVSQTMITYLAEAACNVITCDKSLMPTPIERTNSLPHAPSTPEPQRVHADDGGLPTLEEFITQLVCSSNVQVPTLMSTLVYLTRLRSRLQPMARGLRCTSHRIFLAALILAAKYLNDSSPKNKHWANYSHVATDAYSFGFSRTEVNLMEKQLLFLLDWDLRIREDDLYCELDLFLDPIREDLQLKHARRLQRRRIAAEEKLRHQQDIENQMRIQLQLQLQRQQEQHQQQQQQQQQQQEMCVAGVFSPTAVANTNPAAAAAAAAAMYPTPPASRDASCTRYDHRRSSVETPPELSYSSSANTPHSDDTPAAAAAAGHRSRSGTPLSHEALDGAYMYLHDGAVYEAPNGDVVVVDDRASRSRKGSGAGGGRMMLPYEISADELREMQEDGGKSKRLRMGRAVLGRFIGAVSVR